MKTLLREANELSSAAASRDPAVGLRAVAALRRLADTLEVLQVETARAQDWNWVEIAHELGVTKQAVHQKYVARRRLRKQEP